MKNGNLVSQEKENEFLRTTHNKETQETSPTPNGQERNSSTIPTTEKDVMPIIRQKYKKLGYSNKVITVLMKGWRIDPKKQYQIYLEKWILYCNKRKWVPDVYNVKNCIKLLMHFYTKNS